MSVNQSKIESFFDRATTLFGLNNAAHLHRAIERGETTYRVRQQIRKVIAISSHGVL